MKNSMCFPFVICLSNNRKSIIAISTAQAPDSGVSLSRGSFHFHSGVLHLGVDLRSKVKRLKLSRQSKFPVYGHISKLITKFSVPFQVCTRTLVLRSRPGRTTARQQSKFRAEDHLEIFISKFLVPYDLVINKSCLGERN